MLEFHPLVIVEKCCQVDGQHVKAKGSLSNQSKHESIVLACPKLGDTCKLPQIVKCATFSGKGMIHHEHFMINHDKNIVNLDQPLPSRILPGYPESSTGSLEAAPPLSQDFAGWQSAPASPRREGGKPWRISQPLFLALKMFGSFWKYQGQISELCSILDLHHSVPRNALLEQCASESPGPID